jgi:hypothetical protein
MVKVEVKVEGEVEVKVEGEVEVKVMGKDQGQGWTVEVAVRAEVEP